MIVHIFVKTLPAKHLLQSDRKIFHTNDLAVLWGAASRYKVQYFPEIDRLINSQTIDTMIANKLVAITDRSAQHKTIAGRDIYDIHHFFVQGYPYNYNPAVIQERTGLEPAQYFAKLFAFIKKRVTRRSSTRT